MIAFLFSIADIEVANPSYGKDDEAVTSEYFQHSEGTECNKENMSSDTSEAAAAIGTVLVIIKLTKYPVPVRLYCGSGELIFFIILSCFEIFKKVVHSLEPLWDAE